MSIGGPHEVLPSHGIGPIKLSQPSQKITSSTGWRCCPASPAW